jgi:hypothetical protein
MNEETHNVLQATAILCFLERIHVFIYFFFNLHSGGWSPNWGTRHVGHSLAYCTSPGWLWGWIIWWNEWQGKPKYSEKTCPDATLSTTNPTWPEPGLNPDRRGGKPATNRFSYGAAMSSYNWSAFCPSPSTTFTNQFILDVDIQVNQFLPALLYIKTSLYINTFLHCNRNSSVGIAMVQKAAVQLAAGKAFLSSQHQDRIWGLPSLITNGYWGLFPWV